MSHVPLISQQHWPPMCMLGFLNERVWSPPQVCGSEAMPPTSRGVLPLCTSKIANLHLHGSGVGVCEIVTKKAVHPPSVQISSWDLLPMSVRQLLLLICCKGVRICRFSKCCRGISMTQRAIQRPHRRRLGLVVVQV